MDVLIRNVGYTLRSPGVLFFLNAGIYDINVLLIVHQLSPQEDKG